ncbi:MAG: ABC transporter permease, partial [Acidobacteriota bacterium]
MKPRRRRLRERWIGAIERRLPASLREFLIGDLLEEMDRRRNEQGVWRSRWWAFRQVLGLVRHGWLSGGASARPSGRRGGETKDRMATLTQLGPAIYRDLRFGSRRLLRAPVPSLVIVATLAVGIGLNSLVFMLADSVLFRPLPYEDPGRLVNLVNVDDRGAWYGSSEPEVLELEELPVFESVGALTEAAYVLESGERTRRVIVARANAALLPSLGVQPLYGRFPDRGDDAPGAEPVAVVSHGFWR